MPNCSSFRLVGLISKATTLFWTQNSGSSRFLWILRVRADANASWGCGRPTRTLWASFGGDCDTDWGSSWKFLCSSRRGFWGLFSAAKAAQIFLCAYGGSSDILPAGSSSNDTSFIFLFPFSLMPFVIFFFVLNSSFALAFENHSLEYCLPDWYLRIRSFLFSNDIIITLE